MYSPEEQHRDGSVGVAPRRRGRPRKPEPPTTAELFALMQTMMAQHAKVMDQLATSQVATTDMLRTWMQLYLPTNSPGPSTSANERALKAAEDTLSEWDPLDEHLDPREVLKGLM